jgi:tetratricopeptide (TPR) repeat protein
MKKPDPTGDDDRVSKLIIDAELSSKSRDWQRANELFRQAILLDKSPASRIAYGVCLSQQERYCEAISIFTTVLDVDDRQAVGIVCHNLAAIYREVGDLDLARRFQWRATLLLEDAGPEELLAMANDALANESYETSESLLMAAIEMSSDIADEVQDGDLVATLGLIQAEITTPREGMMTLFSAYRRHQEIQDFRGMGNDLLNMSALFGRLQRRRAERACLERAIRCFEKVSAICSIKRANDLVDRHDRIQFFRQFDGRRN